MKNYDFFRLLFMPGLFLCLLLSKANSICTHSGIWLCIMRFLLKVEIKFSDCSMSVFLSLLKCIWVLNFGTSKHYCTWHYSSYFPSSSRMLDGIRLLLRPLLAANTIQASQRKVKNPKNPNIFFRVIVIEEIWRSLVHRSESAYINRFEVTICNYYFEVGSTVL